MKKIIVIILFFPHLLCGQEIIGLIRNAESLKPIHLANIYFAGSQKGTVSDKNGEFKLSTIRQGAYDLVISHVSYEDFTRKVEILSDTLIRLNILLKPEADAMDEMVIRPDTTNWWQNYVYFKELIIGNSQNAQFTKILNPRSLFFEYEEKEKDFRAYAGKVLAFENKALGYRLYYDLKEFRLQMKSGFLTYNGIPRFEPLESPSKKQNRKWKAARRKAYLGSFIHFLQALKDDALAENGFVVHQLIREYNERPPQKLIAQKVAFYRKQVREGISEKRISFEDMDSPEMDSLRYWSRIQKLPQYSDSLGREISRKSELMNQENVINYVGYLKVVYTKEREDVRYSFTLNRGGAPKNFQSSKIRFLRKGIKIYENNYYDHQAIIFEGYLGWYSRLGESLPLEYDPGEKYFK